MDSQVIAEKSLRSVLSDGRVAAVMGILSALLAFGAASEDNNKVYIILAVMVLIWLGMTYSFVLGLLQPKVMIRHVLGGFEYSKSSQDKIFIEYEALQSIVIESSKYRFGEHQYGTVQLKPAEGLYYVSHVADVRAVHKRFQEIYQSIEYDCDIQMKGSESHDA